MFQKKKQTVVGGTVLFYLNRSVCLVFYNVVNEKYSSTRLSSLQLYRAMCSAKKRHCKIVDFGVSHTPGGEDPLSPKFSLISFKEQFGAQGSLRIVYQKDLSVS